MSAGASGFESEQSRTVEARGFVVGTVQGVLPGPSVYGIVKVRSLSARLGRRQDVVTEQNCEGLISISSYETGCQVPPASVVL